MGETQDVSFSQGKANNSIEPLVSHIVPLRREKISQGPTHNQYSVCDIFATLMLLCKSALQL